VEDGVIVDCHETIEIALRAGPMVRGKGISAVAIASWREAHGVKRMPTVRVRNSDGVRVGQVYLRGEQWKGEMRKAKLPDGTEVEFIFADLPGLEPKEIPRLAAPMDLTTWNQAGFRCGAPLEVFAFLAGLSHDTVLADLVQRVLQQPLRVWLDELEGRVIWPETVEGYKLPGGFEPFKCPYPKYDNRAFIDAGLNGHLNWKKWQRKLGWKGPGAACAAWYLREIAWSNSKGAWDFIPDGLIDFALPEVGTVGFDAWEV
jgi:hypothetical protein